MDTKTVLKLSPSVPSIDQSRVEILDLMNVSSRAGLIWDGLSELDRNIFCRAAGLKQLHINLPLNQFHKLDRLKLIKAIKSTEQAAKQFADLSFKDFK
jgi:hypothetical protein